jgi:hypothetical protein
MELEDVMKKVNDRFKMFSEWNVGADTSEERRIKEVSIEYAIGVLKELMRIEKRDNRYLHDLVKEKITELNNLLKH